MFVASKQTLTARVSEANRDEFNAFLERYQTHFKVEFTTFGGFLDHLKSNAEIFPAEVTKPSENVVNVEPEQIELFKTRNQLPENATPENVVNIALTRAVVVSTEVLENAAEFNEGMTQLANAAISYAEREGISMEDKNPLEVCVQALTAAPIVKEVPVSIGENDLLLKLKPDYMKCLQAINENRNEALAEQETPTETIETTALGLIFNDGTKYNRAGEFYTGLE